MNAKQKATEMVNAATFGEYRTFTDDRILCQTVHINDVSCDLMWCGWELVAAMSYMDESERAKDEVISYFADQLEVWGDIIQDYARHREEEGEDLDDDENTMTFLDAFNLTKEDVLAYAPNN